MKQSALEAHNQIHSEALAPHEELVNITSPKGDIQQLKLDHKHKKVFIPGGPEEDCAFKSTNASYDAVLKSLGRSADNSHPIQFEPVESVPVDFSA